MSPPQPYAALAGRILVSVIFLLSGVMKIMDWSGNAAYMESHGMPAIPVLLTAAIVVEILGGLAVLLGYQTRAVALILFLYLIPTTLIFHNFWTLHGPEQQNQMFHFLKNLAIMGGLLEFCAAGAGSVSLDAAAARRSGPFAFWPRLRRPV